MPGGLVALLDDIAGLTKLAAASLDDVGAAAARAGAKAAGVVVDDTAVTPRYVAGLTPDRELPIIARITLGSLRNKLLILLPVALLLSALAPWAITPLLMVGGCYLCFEGAEKLIDALGGGHADAAEAHYADAAALEKAKIGGAVRTDLILSAEIMAIALAEVADKPIWEQGVVLALVGLAITVGVYGVVALIVKLDDIGLRIARGRSGVAQAIGRGMVKAMPVVMTALGTIGTGAMLWVGGGILIHGLETLGLDHPAAWIHRASAAAAGALPLDALVAWGVTALASGLAGLAVGGVLAGGVHLLPDRPRL